MQMIIWRAVIIEDKEKNMKRNVSKIKYKTKKSKQSLQCDIRNKTYKVQVVNKAIEIDEYSWCKDQK